jgi:hypothetical protein
METSSIKGSHMNRWKIATFLFAGLLVTSIGLNVSQKASAEPQPHMRSALSQLEGALGELKSAEHDKGGWRRAAINATETAIRETHKGIEFDNHH